MIESCGRSFSSGAMSVSPVRPGARKRSPSRLADPLKRKPSRSVEVDERRSSPVRPRVVNPLGDAGGYDASSPSLRLRCPVVAKPARASVLPASTPYNGVTEVHGCGTVPGMRNCFSTDMRIAPSRGAKSIMNGPCEGRGTVNVASDGTPLSWQLIIESSPLESSRDGRSPNRGLAYTRDGGRNRGPEYRIYTARQPGRVLTSGGSPSRGMRPPARADPKPAQKGGISRVSSTP